MDKSIYNKQEMRDKITQHLSELDKDVLVESLTQIAEDMCVISWDNGNNEDTCIFNIDKEVCGSDLVSFVSDVLFKEPLHLDKLETIHDVS
jgi:hypothetical protein